MKAIRVMAVGIGRVCGGSGGLLECVRSGAFPRIRREARHLIRKSCVMSMTQRDVHRGADESTGRRSPLMGALRARDRQ
jgi:hypothetical protein